jgi:hypothetical protein
MGRGSLKLEGPTPIKTIGANFFHYGESCIKNEGNIYSHNILEPTTGVTFFNSGFKSDPTELFPSLVLVIACEKRFPPPNFNLKIVRIQRGSGSWMLLDVVLYY